MGLATGGQMETVNINVFGKDLKVQKAMDMARSFSMLKSPVLIKGESGVGKKTLGRFIHENSNRSSGAFLIVDCAKEPKEVSNAVLGYRNEETGKFYRGVLEAGNGGTVVFSNIDALEENFQKRISTIFGELEDYDLDIRIIATTTTNLSKLVGAAKFYRKLYDFVSHNCIDIPPLRERVSDLKMIARYFAAQRIDGKSFEISDEAMKKITSHYWIHNIHELKEVIDSSVDGNSDGMISEINLDVTHGNNGSVSQSEQPEGIRLMSLKEAEQILIKKALLHTSENRTQAAKILGVSIRTLRNKINEYRRTGSSYFVNLK